MSLRAVTKSIPHYYAHCLFCIAVGTAIAWCGGRCAMPDGHCLNILLFHGSLGLPGWRLFRGFTLLSPCSHSSPSLIGLLASVDVKQQKLTMSIGEEVQVLFCCLSIHVTPIHGQVKALLQCLLYIVVTESVPH